MKIACLQLTDRLGDPDFNFAHAEQAIRAALVQHRPDVLTLPETWNTGFFPKEALSDCCDREGQRTKTLLSGLAREFHVNIVGGSVSDLRGGKVYNSAYVFGREGDFLCRYDKMHAFSPSGEDGFYTGGTTPGLFALDGVPCGGIVCYDLRFPELTRRLCAAGAQILFVAAQWPGARAEQLRILARARAIENQIFLVLNNSCAGDNAGGSCIIDPLGNVLAEGGSSEEVVAAVLDLGQLSTVRAAIPVWNDRRPDLY